MPVARFQEMVSFFQSCDIFQRTEVCAGPPNLHFLLEFFQRTEVDILLTFFTPLAVTVMCRIADEHFRIRIYPGLYLHLP